MLRACLLVAVALAAAACPFAAVGCQDFPPLEPCGEIPAGGCPAGLSTCSDPTCTGLYSCVSGVWTSMQLCPPPDGGMGGADGGGSSGAGGGVPEGGPCTPVKIDTSGEAMNCTPDLENPDCPVEAALGCAETVCLTGCLDFFLCTATTGWLDVAYCDDQGNLVVTRPPPDGGS